MSEQLGAIMPAKTFDGELWIRAADVAQLQQDLRRYENGRAVLTILVDALKLRLLQAADEIEQLRALLACAYQLAGVVGAPVRFLDAFSNLKGTIEELLPVTLAECEEFQDLTKERDELQKEIGKLHLENL